MSIKVKKICLCMIVKNEAHIIERCLDSAKPIIDFISICDTGSKDATPDKIKQWCKQNHIQGTVHHEPFSNFGYNRTIAVQLAQKTYPEADYLLLMDADMVLEINPEFNKNLLDLDQYMTMQYTNTIKYWLPRLLKTNLPWISIGVTHEYWDINRSEYSGSTNDYIESKGKINSLIIRDEEDGGSKSDKFERDKQLLVQALNDPETPRDLEIRYMFYLAQTYICLKEYDSAIKWYKLRVDADGWEEEVFYSLQQIGLCYENLARDGENNHQNNVEHNWALSILFLQRAWEYRPSRAEPLYHLARIQRYLSNYQLGLMFAEKGSLITFPSEDILFVDYRVYDYLLDLEISICGYYSNNKYQNGQMAQKRLEMKLNTLPRDVANLVIQNSQYY